MNKIIVIGGVAGGASAAARIRRLDEAAVITMYEKGAHVSFSNCALPYFLSRKVKHSGDLVLMNPSKFKSLYNIDAFIKHEVIKILPNEKKVLVKNLETNEVFEDKYDSLILSPGAIPIMPRSIKGIDLPHVFNVRNVEDIRRIDSYIKEHNVEDVAVIGGGFIGIEVMENLRESGINTVLIEASDQVMMPFDKDMVQILHKEIIDNNVNLVLNDGLLEINDEKVITSSKKEFKAHMVIMAIGVRPEVSLAVDAGIKLGVSGAIEVDANFRTNYNDIYAVGDAIQTFSSLTHKPTRLTLAGPAQRQARIAADSIYKRPRNNKGVIGSSAVRIFDLNAASTGLNEKQCIKEGFQFDYVYIIPKDIVGIMPDANPIHFKLIFEVPTGRILGAQAIGKGNVDKRIDVIATMITMNGTLYDLEELELSYSPLYNNAKDVVNQAAMTGINILNKEFKQIKVSEIRSLYEQGACIIDCREEIEYNKSHIIGAINIPTSQFRDRLSEIPKDKPVYFHCHSGQRSYTTVRALGNLGYDNVYNISGSYLGLCLYEYYTDLVSKREKIVTDYNFI